MYRKAVEYIIITAVIILIAYGAYSFLTYSYPVHQDNITDTIEIQYPASSNYTLTSTGVEFENTYYAFYDMNVSRLDSTSDKARDFLKNYTSTDNRAFDYKNETAYLLTCEYEDENGFMHHTLIVPVKSFDKDNLSFTQKTKVCLFDTNNWDFAVHTAFDSQVIL